MFTLLTEKLQPFHVKNAAGSTSGRVVAIDALRGFDMFWIMGGELIFKSLDPVFHSSTTQWMSTQLDHVAWLGFRFYDIIMPLFLFIVGVSMPFSFKKRISKGDSSVKMWKHILIRFVILFVLGMAVQGNLLTYSFSKFHFYSNTLQSIACGYILASVLVLHCKVFMQIIGTIGFMLLYWLVMAFLPLPGGVSGVYQPDLNAAIYIDKLILGAHQDGTTYSWLLSSLNFAGSVMLGVFSGYILQSSFSAYKKVLKLVGLGIVCYFLALLWHPVHPIIKHIWTGSFVLYAGSFSIFLLAAFYLIIEVYDFRKWSYPFIIIGSNAIVAYVAWHLFDFRLVSDVFTRGLQQYTSYWYDFIRNLAGFGVIFLILRYMYINKKFIKV